MDLSKLNMVSPSTAVTSNYDLSGRETSLVLYFNDDEDVIIVGQVDANYIYWASLTKTCELEKNEAIFNHVANEPFVLVSSWRNIGLLSHDELKRYYRAELRRTGERDMAWRTPFGHYYGRKQMAQNGGYFAKDVAGFVSVLHRRCEFREAGGAYEAMLDFWLVELAKAEADAHLYPRVEPLVEMMKQESYLVLSRRAPIREKYLLLCEKAGEVYNRYMSAVR